MSAPSSASRNACAIAVSTSDEAAAVGEAVGRDVDDPHDARAIEREAGKARARGADRLDELGGGERVAPPVALEGVAKGGDAALRAGAIALDDLDGRVAQRLPGERQSAPCLLALV